MSEQEVLPKAKPPHYAARRLMDDFRRHLGPVGAPVALGAVADFISDLAMTQRLFADDWINDVLHKRVEFEEQQ